MKQALAIAVVLVLAACSGGGTSKLPHDPAKDAPPGKFAVDWITDYSSASCAQSIPVFLGANPEQAGAENFAAQLTATNSRGSWSETFEHSQQQVSATDFAINGSNGNDAIYFAGHGDFGLALLPYCGQTKPLNQQYFGPGAVTPGAYNQGSARNINLIVGPKWMFFASSDTVTPPAGLYPGDNSQFDGDWRPAFRTSVGHPGGLRGIYGAWQGPGSCNDINLSQPPGRVCDISAIYAGSLGQKLGEYLWSNVQPIVVHDAWDCAAVDAGLTVGASEVEDVDDLQDTFTGNVALDGTPAGYNYSFNYINPTLPSAQPHAVTITPQTFTLTPETMTPESWNESNSISRAQSYLGESVSKLVDPAKANYSTQSGLYAAHVGNSGAVVMNAASQRNPMSFSLSQAQSYAQSYVAQTLGMPSDAVLASSSAITTYDMNAGSGTTVGYVITYLHQNGNVAGGDAIHVIVDDAVTYTSGPCLEYDYSDPDPPQQPHKYCAEYQQIPHDSLNVSHMYRLWRSMTAVKQVHASGRSTGDQSINAVTASNALPNPSAVTTYSPGYWTPSSEQDNGAGAEPVWLFTVGNDSIVAVDAFSDQIIGTSTF